MKRTDYTAANREAWNEAAPIHRERRFDALLHDFKKQSHSVLDEIATAHLKRINVVGKDAAQICCNNGRELISIKNMGARHCVGFDISDDFIAQARQLNEAAKRDCQFVQSDAYEIPDNYSNSFDLVVITIGALCWLPDLPLFFETVSRLLRPSGWLFIYEMHPILDMFECDRPDKELIAEHSYFRTEPFIETNGLDYIGKTKYQSKPQYSFHHKLSEIIGACLSHGLALRSFEEYDHDISTLFPHFEKASIKPPLCYTLTAQKEPE